MEGTDGQTQERQVIHVDPDLERRFLGACLGTPETLDRYPLPASDLGDPRAVCVLSAMYALRARPDRPDLDPIAIEEMLKTQGTWRRVGHEYLLALENEIVIPSSVPVIRSRIRELSALRRAREAAMMAAAAFERGELSEGMATLSDMIQGPGLDSAEERVKPLSTVCEETALAVMEGRAAGYASLGGSLFPTLDAAIRLTGGMLILLGAHSNVGKSSLMMALLLDLAERGTPCGIISLEDPEVDFGAKALGQLAHQDPAKLWRGEPKSGPAREEWPEVVSRFIDAAGKSRDIPLAFSAPRNQHVDAVLEDMAHMVRVHGSRIIGIDYLQAVQGGRGNSPRERVDDCLARIIVQMRILGCDVFLASQLADRDGNPFKEPHLGQLKESRTITERAQTIVLAWREGDTPGAVHRFKVAKAKRQAVGLRGVFERDPDSKSVAEVTPSGSPYTRHGEGSPFNDDW